MIPNLLGQKLCSMETCISHAEKGFRRFVWTGMPRYLFTRSKRSLTGNRSRRQVSISPEATQFGLVPLAARRYSTLMRDLSVPIRRNMETILWHEETYNYNTFTRALSTQYFLPPMSYNAPIRASMQWREGARVCYWIILQRLEAVEDHLQMIGHAWVRTVWR